MRLLLFMTATSCVSRKDIVGSRYLMNSGQPPCSHPWSRQELPSPTASCASSLALVRHTHANEQ